MGNLQISDDAHGLQTLLVQGLLLLLISVRTPEPNFPSRTICWENPPFWDFPAEIKLIIPWTVRSPLIPGPLSNPNFLLVQKWSNRTFNLTWEIAAKEKSKNCFKMSLNFYKRFWQRKYSNHIVIAGVNWFHWHFIMIEINHGSADSRTTRKPRKPQTVWGPPGKFGYYDIRAILSLWWVSHGQYQLSRVIECHKSSQ